MDMMHSLHPSNFSQPSPLPPPLPHVLFTNSLTSAACNCVEHGTPTNGHAVIKEKFFLPSTYRLPVEPQKWVGPRNL